MSEAEAARRLKISESTLVSWEKGHGKPSLAQARRLAQLYRRPLAVLFLPEPPKSFDALQTFRRVHGGLDSISPAVALQVQEALERREALIELSRETSVELKKFPLTSALSDAAPEAATEARQVLRLSTNEQFRWTDAREALNSWRSAIENLDVLVFQFSRVNVDELRGVSVHQDIFPIVGINAGDSLTARIFSLAHELGHLALGGGELCVPEDESALASNGVEIWCNEFAGSLLVPSRELLASEELGAPSVDLFEVSKSIANRFRVSEEVILRRFVTLNRLQRRAYQTWRASRGRFEDWQAPSHGKGKKKTGGPPPDAKVLANFGRPFVRAVFEALHQEKISLSEAAGLLELKFKHFSRIESRLVAAEGEAEVEG